MVEKTRVFIVDDSVLYRKILISIISSDPEFEVAGVASTGAAAIAKISLLNPDVILLDIDMPETDGMVTLCEIRKLQPKLPVIIFSSVCEKSAARAVEAMVNGANEFVAISSNMEKIEDSIKFIKTELAHKIKMLKKKASPVLIQSEVKRPPQGTNPVEKAKIDIIAIGVSTGGPEALLTFFSGLPKDIGVPIVVVQHIPQYFTKLLVNRLAMQVKLKVVEASDEDVIAANCVYIAPSDFHLTVKREGIQIKTSLTREPPENSCRPSVDVLFSSVARVYGRGALAIVLTGMGQDGMKGAIRINQAGGTVVVQDKPSSVVWSMPGSIVSAGVADGIFPINEMAVEILRRIK